MCIYVKTQTDVYICTYIYVSITHTCVCVNIHLCICQEHDEGYKSKKFHVHNMSPHYTRLRVLSPLGEGLGIEIQVTIKEILAKSKMFFFLLSGWK